MQARILLTLLVLAFSSPGKAQSSSTLGLFPTIDHSGDIGRKFAYSLYYFGGLNAINSKINGIKPPSEFGVFYAEHALHYNVVPRLSFTGSYVYERQHPVSDNYRNENRFYLQVTYKQDYNHTNLKHRLRYDGRFIQNRATGETPFTSRVRYLLGITTPLGRSRSNLYFTAYNEFFFNTYSKATVTYAENWAAAALGYKTKGASSFEVGPLYIFWVNNAQYDLTNFVYLQLAWVTHIDFTKRKIAQK